MVPVCARAGSCSHSHSLILDKTDPRMSKAESATKNNGWKFATTRKTMRIYLDSCKTLLLYLFKPVQTYIAGNFGENWKLALFFTLFLSLSNSFSHCSVILFYRFNSVRIYSGVVVFYLACSFLFSLSVQSCEFVIWSFFGCWIPKRRDSPIFHLTELLTVEFSCFASCFLALLLLLLCISGSSI